MKVKSTEGNKVQPLIDEVETWKNTYRKLATDTEVLAKKAKPTDLKRIEVLNMISEFRDFCLDYLQEIDALHKQSNEGLLSYEEDVLNTLRSYWAAILVGAKQHIPGHAYRSYLEAGYKKLNLLQASLKTRPNFKDISFPQIVLYFFEEKGTAKAQRFPFGNTRLIGIPLSDVSNVENKEGWTEDWMSMSHELGHHIYWNARFSDEDNSLVPAPGTNFLNKEIESAIAEMIKLGLLKKDAQDTIYIRNMLDAWTEEIFAEVVGAVIGGQDFLNATWRLISKKEAPVANSKRVTEAERKALFQSDGEHPFPYLRPYLRYYAMREIDDNARLINKWADYYGGMPYEKLSPGDTAAAKQISITISTLRRACRAYVERILARLRNLSIAQKTRDNRKGLDKLAQGYSSLQQLKDFIHLVKPNEDETAILIALLKPMILEKGEYWRCACGQLNSAGRAICAQCASKRSFWSYLPWW
jgi:hypothetical protein